MESWIIENFTFQNVMLVCIVGFFAFPYLKKWILKDKKIEDTGANLTERVRALESDMEDLKKKVRSDFYVLQDIQTQTKDSLEERRILMKAVVAILKGLQEIGANGPTKEAQNEIEDYLTNKAHRN